MRWLAFLQVKGQVETYQQFSDDLEEVNVGLTDWLDMDDQARDMKLDFARQMES